MARVLHYTVQGPVFQENIMYLEPRPLKFPESFSGMVRRLDSCNIEDACRRVLQGDSIQRRVIYC